MIGAYSEHCQTSKMERSAKITNSFLPLTVFAKRSVLDVWQDSEYATFDVMKKIIDVNKAILMIFFVSRVDFLS